MPKGKEEMTFSSFAFSNLMLYLRSILILFYGFSKPSR
jgi:hypothetical protein